MNKIVYAVYGDIMTAREVLPAMQVLGSRGFLITHIVDQSESEKATMILDKEGVVYTKNPPTSEDVPDVIIAGTSDTSINAQIEWTLFGREKNIPVIWVEDFYGGGERSHTICVSPDIMCTLNNISAEMIRELRRDVDVRIVGKPSAEYLSKYLGRTNELKKHICNKLNVDTDSLIITLWSGGMYFSRVEAHIKALLDLHKLTDREIVYCPRMHPKFSYGKGVELLRFAFENNKNAKDTSGWVGDDIDKLMLVSSINIGDYAGNMLYYSVAFNIPSVVCLFPQTGPDGVQDRIRQGFEDGLPPLVTENAGWGAESSRNLRDILDFIMNNEVEAITQVKKNSGVFRALVENVGAAERIADVVENSIR